MKATIVLTLAFLLSVINSWSLSGGYDYYIFYTTEGKPYAEIYYWVNGQTIKYLKSSDTKKQGELEISIMIGLQDTSKVFSYEKFRLKTEEFNSADSLYSDVYDVKRIMIPAGVSFLEISVQDVNSDVNNSRFSAKDTIVANDVNSSKVFLSNIQLIHLFTPTSNENRFSKGGYDILPYHDSYYATDQGKITFYTEIVNADKALNPGGKYLVNCYIEDA